MDYLNYYSLKKSRNHDELRSSPTEKILKLTNITYNFLFFLEGKVITKEKNPFFFKSNKVSKNLLKFPLSFIANKKNNFYILCSLKKDDLKKIGFLKTCTLLNIREFLFDYKTRYSSLISAGYSLHKWQHNNRYCGSCGSITKMDDNGNSIVCTKIKCGKKIFPVVYPTVIVSISCGKMILLARSLEWKKNLYSCLAGFCEQNESAEDAVKREVYEEVGLEVEKINYKYSQFWPFSSNLMLGFEAKVSPRKNAIKIIKKEIDEAKWFSSKEIVELSRKNELILPKKEAIALSLIEDWIYKN